MRFESTLEIVEEAVSVASGDRLSNPQPQPLSYPSNTSEHVVIQLPYDFLKLSTTPYQPDRIEFTLPSCLSSRWHPQTDSPLTVESILLSAFATLLYRYTRQEALCLDVRLPAIASLQAVTVSMADDLPMPDLLHQVTTALANLNTGPDNSSDRLPSPVRFTVWNAQAEAAIPMAVCSEPLDLHLQVVGQGAEVRGLLDYNTHVFRRSTLDRMVGHLGQILEACMTDRHPGVGTVPLLTPAEAQQIREDWRSPSVSYGQQPIFKAIEAHAVRQPEAIAIRFEDQQLTYGDLNQRANQLAYHLIQLGVGPEVRVASCLEPSLDVMVGVLAILKAGGVYVPLDPNHPVERLAVILADTQPQVLLTQAPLEAIVPASVPHIFCLDRDWATLTNGPTHNPDLALDLNQTAYIIYTSGTTGKPKGVMASHANLVNYIWVAQDAYGFTAQDVMPAIARFTFSITMFELFSPLVAGGELRLLSRDHILDFKRMIQTLEEVTLVHTSPSLWRKLIQHIQDHSIDSSRFQRLRHVSSGGDLVPADLLEAMKQVFPAAEVFVIYGCSEISCMGCTYPVSRDQTVTKTWVGKSFPNVSVRLYDAQQNLVPIGVVGEIYFSGAGINKGYLNQEALTQEKFITLDGERFYNTGDLGRFHADGNLEILGRADFQIKLRGMRMEPGEIEATLRQFPGVRESIVAAQQLQGNVDKTLVGYVVLDAAAKPSLDALRPYLQTKLPDYMVPTLFVELEAMPVNLNGKVDRRALPIPERLDLQQRRQPWVAPTTEPERQLVEIWEAVLHLQPIGIQDNFFELGGDSLTAAQVIYRVQETFNRDLPISQLFVQPTVAGLAEYLAQPAEMLRAELAPILPIPRDPYLPLSLAQARLWFLTQLEEGIAYNIPLAFHLEGHLDRAVLERSLTEMVRRHEALRTTFPVVEGSPVQRILPPQPIALPLVELRSLPPGEQSSETYRLTQEEAQRPFHLATQLPIRATLLCLSETAHVLLLTVHHIVSDGWSLALMRQELAALYTAFLAGEPSPLAELPFQYADFAHWHQAWVQEAVLAQQLPYWQRQLAGAPPLLELPTDHPRPPIQTYRGGTEFFTVDGALTRRLKAVSQQAGATLFMTLMAAFATLLSRYSKQEDVVIGSPIANRNRSDMESLMGFFINLLAMRIDLSGNPGFLELVQRVRQVALGAYAHQELPFDQLVQAMQPERNLSQSPLFQVLFILQNSPMAAVDLPGLALSPLKVESGTAKYDLTLMMEETAEGLTAELEFNRDLFDRETIVRMVGHFQMLLQGIVTHPTQPIALLPILTQAERQQLLTEWNNTELAYPPEACIHQLFESQVERTPEAIALVFGAEQLTYADLNRQANQVAHYLRSLGVGPDMLVGICIERSLAMVVGLLGILKAGGSYVPLDPAYPRDRLAYMIEDSQLPILLTQQMFSEPFAEQSVRMVCLDRDWDTIAQHPTHNPTSGVTGDHLAYTIYTSGSTGKPKGVQLMHRTAVNFLNSMRYAPGLDENDVLLAVTTISFDIAVLELYLPLMVGARTVIATRENAADAAQLYDLLIRSGATVMQATPVTWHMLLARGWEGDGHLKMLCGGEAMPRTLADQLLARGGSLWNMYGPTETTVWSAACRIEAGKGSVPVAAPIANTQIYVLDNLPGPDAAVQLVPVGIPGEVHIGGDGLARGYLNRPELTQERFIPDPFRSQPGARLYKTGDLARFRPDGSLEFLGRIDHQVKLRGFRIELGEIEAILSQHPAVKQGAVIVREDVPGDQRLVAYWTAKAGDLPTAQDLRAFLKQHLPNYMVPSIFILLAAMPLTPNGKIDRRSLPLPDSAVSDRTSERVPPRTEVERQLVEIWENLLHIRPIGVQDDFFDLGGTSLLTVSLIAQIQQGFGKELPLSTLMTAPTIEQLAQTLKPSAVTETPGDSLVLIKPGMGETPLFLMHDGDGEILLYRSLANALQTDLPIYGVQPHRREHHPILHTRIPEMAAHYIQQIQTLQPQGPYLLGGLCAGATLAFEMALQLQRQGQEVAMVAILDAADVQAEKWPNLIAQQRLSRFSEMFEGVSNLKPHQRALALLTQASQKVANLITYEVTERLNTLYARTRLNLFRYCLDHNLPLPPVVQNIPVRPTHLFALQSYAPEGIFKGEVVLFRASEKSAIFDGTGIDDTPHCQIFSDPLLGWERRVTEGVIVYDVPGGHSSMLQEPNVRILADKLQTYIEQGVISPTPQKTT